MSFIFRQIKLGQRRFSNRLRLMYLWTTADDNFIGPKNNIKIQKYSTDIDDSFSDSAIKKYLKSIITLYRTNDNRDNDLSSIFQIQDVVNLLENRLHIEENMKNVKELGGQDDEMQQIAHEEYAEYQNNLNKLDKELFNIILDNIGKEHCHDIIFEITAGVGGQEAMMFCADLYNMYRKHFEYLNYNYEPIEIATESGINGVRNASILVSGDRVFELLRHESGVHRVQRVPASEKYGRIHTSTASIIVLQQSSDLEIDLQHKDLKIQTKRASGAGGQSVNTTDSAVRITHLPTGIMVDAQSERSQIQNKKIALLRLKTKLYNIQMDKQQSDITNLRKKQKGMSQRNEKIRTYNYSQNRVTDHRLTNGTFHNLKGFMEGGESLKNLQERLQRDYQLRLLEETIEKYK